MSSDQDEIDPDEAMREMMGFSSFNTVGKARDKAKESPPAPRVSGANAEPMQSRVTGHGLAAYSSQDVKSHLDNTMSSTSLTASAPKFVSNIPAFLTPASVLPTTLPPKPPAAFQPGTASPFTNTTHPNALSTVANPFPQLAGPFTTTAPGTESTTTFENTSSDIPYTPAYTAKDRPNTSGNNPRPAVRTNDRGDAVYFKPSFVDPDPWRYAREAKEAKASSEAREKYGVRNDRINGRAHANGGSSRGSGGIKGRGTHRRRS